MKVHIVVENEYEGSTICGVFSTRELADWYKKGAYPYPNCQIEEWEIDSESGKIQRPVWECKIDLDSGKPLGKWYWESGRRLGLPPAFPSRLIGRILIVDDYRPSDRTFRPAAVAASFISPDHARQTAQEVRKAQLIADELGLGPSDSLHYIPANRA